MSRLALLASLMAASVAAQAEFTAPGFKYIGCVEAEPPVFNFKADVPAPFSVQQCQYACHAKGKYAAMDGSCNCYDSSSSKAKPIYKIIDESVCSVPCIGGNTTAGVCGGPQCPVTEKKRYSLYKKEMGHHDDDDREEKKTKSKDVGVWTKYVSTTVATVTACPPEVTDCPLSPTKATATPHCPGEGCNVPTTSAKPTKPPCPEKCGPPCSSEGCPVCPPGCPVWTPVSHPTQTPPVPACDGEHCKIGPPPPATLACPSGGCFHPHPTIIVSKGTRYQSGVLVAVAAVVMAVGWL